VGGDDPGRAAAGDRDTGDGPEWCRQAAVDSGRRSGVTTEEAAELKRLKRENAELKRANAILRSASAFFAAELDRPQR